MKKHVLLLLAIMFGITGCSKSNETTKLKEESNTEKYVLSDDFIKAKVDSVHDGDSIFVTYDVDGEPYSKELYLAGIDAPELIHPIYSEMPFGKEAKENLEKVIKESGDIYIETNEDEKTSTSGRLIGYAYANYEGELIQLNEMQVSQGLARVSDNLENVVDITILQENYDKLAESEKKAKSEKLNIWGIENFVSDKGYDEKYKK